MELASKSTTTSTLPEPGQSAISDEIGVDADIELDYADFGDANDGSDIDEDSDLEDTEWPQDAFEFPNDSAEKPGLTHAVTDLDNRADVALRALDDFRDLLHFDWKGDLRNFEGVREEFVGPSGPTFDISGLTPLDIFKKIWDADIIALIVRETNIYARQLQHKCRSKPKSRIHLWRDTTDDEIWTFLGIIMLQSFVVNNVEREYWYPKSQLLKLGTFGELMSYNRFMLLKKCLHFVDNTTLPDKPNKFHKIKPIIQHLNNKFSSLYLPEQNVTIDESLLLWKGRLSFIQLSKINQARVGMKSYELCELRTGYLWKMDVNPGKGHVYEPNEASQEADAAHELEPWDATSKIVFSLMRPLFYRGHTLVMDNFYNAPLLSRLLKAKCKTDTVGPLRLNREFVPESLEGKNKKTMQVGEVLCSTTKDLSVVVWMDKSVVSMISSFHNFKIGGIEEYGCYKYKPHVVLDYNLSMGGMDRKYQMLNAYPVERVHNMKWYKKLFRRLLNVSIHNSFVIYKHNDTQVGNRNFRLQLADEVLRVHRRQTVPRPPAGQVTPSEMHLPLKNTRQQRCKMCHAAKVRRSTIWRCGTCGVNLCIDGCYSTYHTSIK